MMKKRLLLIGMFFVTLSYVHAADNPLKIGYVQLDYIMNQLPDSKRVEADLKAFELQLRNQLEQKAANFQEKLQHFQKGHTTMTEAAKTKTEQELQQMHSEMEQLQLDSQNSMATKQLELVKPVYEKVQKIIETLAKEQKYTHVFNSNAGGMAIMLYGQEEYDLSDLVLKRLGINPKAASKEEGKTSTKQTASKSKEDTKTEPAKQSNVKK